MKKFNAKIVSFEKRNDDYIVKIQFYFNMWFFKIKTAEEIFYSKDLHNFVHLHTGNMVSTWYSCIFLPRESYSSGEFFERWIAGETYLIKNSLFLDGPTNNIVDLDLVGKIFKAKQESNIIDNDGKPHSVKKDECVTVVGINPVTNNSGTFGLVFCILLNENKIYVKNITNNFEQVS